MQNVPGTHPVDVVLNGAAGICACEGRDKCRDEDGAGRSTLELWNGFHVTVDMKGEETCAVGF